MRVPLPHVFALPVGFCLVALLLLALGYASRRRRAVRRASRRRERLYRCGECAKVYTDRRDVPLAGCPRCGTLNEAVRR
jgi:rRNA maturation endonuclease Nob1